MSELDPYSPYEANSVISTAEEMFLLMSRSPEFAPFLGRSAGLSDEELRSIFGLAVAAIRRAGLGAEPEFQAVRQPVDSTAGLSRAALETQIREMTEALARREDQIRELRSRLEKAEARRRP